MSRPEVSDRAAVKLSRGNAHFDDVLVVEEPLEIRVDGRPIAVLMRTPGDDLDLVAGFLLTEGVIDDADDLAGLSHCADPNAPDARNVVLAVLAPGTRGREARIEHASRALYSASSCGLCGKETIERVFQRLPAPPPPYAPDDGFIAAMVSRLRASQPLFSATGGCHGAALFRPSGELVVCREDIGRHNAVDKCIGARLRDASPQGEPLVLAVSGRAGFEILQKAAMAGLPAVVSVGAASSLAHDLALRAGIALFSFARDGRSNAHSGKNAM